MLSVIIPASLLLGALIGLGLNFGVQRRISTGTDRKSVKLLEDAKAQASELIARTERDASQRKAELLSEIEKRQSFLSDLEKTLHTRELSVDTRVSEIESSRKDLERKKEEVGRAREAVRELQLRQEIALEKVASMSKAEARDELLKTIEQEQQGFLLKRMKELDDQTETEVEEVARGRLATVLSRIGSEITAENTIFAVTIPSEEMKGRLIGKEGRNIQAFEKATGVDLLIDDSPDSVLVASFDPVRREVGRVALEQLIRDGRIHPGRIEEVVQKAVEQVAQDVRKAGEAAVVNAKVVGLPKEIVRILGQLKFRTSYGQNQLAHSIETSKIAGLLADELGADSKVARTAGLLHDLGKALDFEIKAPHHHISADIAKKYGLGDDVVHAILAHHEDIEAETTEAWIVRTADAISGARPGARRGSYEEYVERLKELETVANSFPGVDKSFAIQAGRELRIFVRPNEISDMDAMKLAKKIAAKVEEELTYPGQVKVNVIRETRVHAIAK